VPTRPFIQVDVKIESDVPTNKPGVLLQIQFPVVYHMLLYYSGGDKCKIVCLQIGAVSAKAHWLRSIVMLGDWQGHQI
jgi:hypothetical protein